MTHSLQIRLAAGVLCLLGAYALLIPGLTEPMLRVSGSVEREALVALGRQMLTENNDLPPFLLQLADRFIDSVRVEGSVLVFDKTRSILDTARELWLGNHRPVAMLILLFSVGIPMLKALILLVTALPLPADLRHRLLSIAGASSKWSMADVFVIAIFVAYLAANGLQESRALVDFESQLGPGFQFFAGYCLVSILGTQLTVSALQQHGRSVPATGSKRHQPDSERRETDTSLLPGASRTDGPIQPVQKSD